MKRSVIEASVRATRAWVGEGFVCIALEDGREVRFPVATNNRLAKASPRQMENVELICNGTGLHWPDLDEDLSVSGILAGRWGQKQS